MGHPAVAEAAVIGIAASEMGRAAAAAGGAEARQPRRPPAEILAYYEGKVAKWWMPDAGGIRGEPAA